MHADLSSKVNSRSAPNRNPCGAPLKCQPPGVLLTLFRLAPQLFLTVRYPLPGHIQRVVKAFSAYVDNPD